MLEWPSLLFLQNLPKIARQCPEPNYRHRIAFPPALALRNRIDQKIFPRQTPHPIELRDHDRANHAAAPEARHSWRSFGNLTKSLPAFSFRDWTSGLCAPEPESQIHCRNWKVCKKQPWLLRYRQFRKRAFPIPRLQILLWGQEPENP